MNEDLRAAAERLTANSWDAYIGQPQGRDWIRIADAILGDGRLVARAYLAEHPADDGELVTEEWLLANGFAECVVSGQPGLSMGVADNSVILCLLRRRAFYDAVLVVTGADSDWPLSISTRSDVRKLLAALCIIPEARS